MSKSDNTEVRHLRRVLRANRRALAPFAAAGRLLPDARDENGNPMTPDSTPIITIGNAPGPYATVTFGDLRRAAGVVG